MDIISLETKCKKVSELRKQRFAIQKQINDIVAEVIVYMKEQDRKRFKVAGYSLELTERIRRDFDFKFLDELQAKGLLPESKMKKTSFERLLITSSQDIKLVGNKFVMVDDDE